MLDINEVIIRFLDRSATSSEKAFLLDWLKQSEENRNDFSETRDLWLLSNTIPADDIETELALDRLKERILPAVPQKKKFALSPMLYAAMRVAAVVLLLCTVGFTFYTIGEHSVKEESHIMNRLLTASEGKGRFVLPDSTVVWLNANTMLEYPENFSSSSREVRLEGEAYFEVKRNEKKPFRVQAGEMNVEVLGTHFMVENYPHKSNLEAVLVEGSVKIAGCKMNHSVVLTPGQLISYNKKDERTDVQIVNTDNYTSWMKDELVFDNHTLADIVVNLEKWYITDIVCDPSFAETVRMSFSIRYGESMDEILKAMELVSPIRYYWKDDVLHITAKKKNE